MYPLEDEKKYSNFVVQILNVESIFLRRWDGWRWNTAIASVNDKPAKYI